MDIKAILDKHDRIVLQFSGGKDSIACLELLKDELYRITVVWMNPGDPLPELVEQMERVKAFCPHFIEITGDSAAQIAERGYPADVLPIRNVLEVQVMTSIERAPLQSFLSCCWSNIMAPMHSATLNLGVTLVIRGQRNVDSHKSQLRSGDVVDGVEYLFPIEDLSDEEVRKCISGSQFLPENYADGNTSLECWHCTGYMKDHQWKLKYLDKHHPEKADEVRRRLIFIKNEITQDMQHMGV